MGDLGARFLRDEALREEALGAFMFFSVFWCAPGGPGLVHPLRSGVTFLAGITERAQENSEKDAGRTYA